MIDLQSIVEGIKVVVDAGNVDLNVYANPPGEGLAQLPALMIVPGGDTFVEYYGTMGAAGLTVIRFDLVLYVAPPAGEIDSMIATYAALGVDCGRSVFDAIEADSTLNGTVGEGRVLSAGPPQLVTLADGRAAHRTVLPLLIHTRKDYQT